MDKKIKISLVVGLLIVIIGMIAVLFVNGKSIFDQHITIEYPDGCKEEYINSELVSPVCENGRALEEKRNKKVDDYNLNFDFE